MNPDPGPKSPSRLDRAKAKRRYVVLVGANVGQWWVARKDASGFMRSVAAGMSQPLARRVAAMLNGGGK